MRWIYERCSRLTVINIYIQLFQIYIDLIKSSTYIVYNNYFVFYLENLIIII